MRGLLLLAMIFCLSAPATALAQADGEQADPDEQAPAPREDDEAGQDLSPTPGPVAEPEPGSATIGTQSGLRLDGRRYVMRGQGVFLRGAVRPFVAGQEVTLEVRRGGRVVERIRKPVTAGNGEAGAFAGRFEPKRTGGYSIRVVHERTAEQAAFQSETARVRVVSPRSGRGSRGTDVELLQRGLRRLGFVVPSGKRFGDGTARAVIAFRKTNGMSRTSRADRGVYRMILRGEGAFKPKHDRRGRYVEFDISRQVLALVRNGRAQRVYHASSGKSSTPTVRGTFRFYRKDRGTNSLGMVHSSYFHFGYAIHGYKSVPTYPASHGCIRVPIPDALSIFRWIDNGDKISVYR